jgi:hypothetical protein
MNTDCNYPHPTEPSLSVNQSELPPEEPIIIRGKQYILMPEDKPQALVLEYDPIMKKWNKVL